MPSMTLDEKIQILKDLFAGIKVLNLNINSASRTLSQKELEKLSKYFENQAETSSELAQY
jgi:hypothetical protein